MAKETAIGEFRNVTVAFDNAAGKDIVNQTAQIAAPIDAFKAVTRAVKESEANFARYGVSGTTDVTAKAIKLTGSIPTVVHNFTLTTNLSAGSYIFIYVSTTPN